MNNISRYSHEITTNLTTTAKYLILQQLLVVKKPAYRSSSRSKSLPESRSPESLRKMSRVCDSYSEEATLNVSQPSPPLSPCPVHDRPDAESLTTLKIPLSGTLLDSDPTPDSGHSSARNGGACTCLQEGLAKKVALPEAVAFAKNEVRLTDAEGTEMEGSGQKAEVESRVQALLAQMTLAERVGQLVLQPGEDAPGMVRPLDLEQRVEAGLIGGVLQVRGVATTRALQECAMRARLRVPLMFGLDVIHGYRVHFPVPIAETASWDLRVPRFYN